ncbi:MAG: GDSL-type esterase/lipase family protein [Planctomycetaceae bacterium]
MRYLLLSCVVVAVAANARCSASGPDASGQSPLIPVKSRMAAGLPTRIVCFGDSITGVYYHSGSQRAWCDMLGIALRKAYPHARLEMVNAGISGHTTVQALARIEKDVLDRKPHLVVVKFGMNDVARGPVGQFKTNLASIVRRCRAVKSAVVLCTPNSVFEKYGTPERQAGPFQPGCPRSGAGLRCAARGSV